MRGQELRRQGKGERGLENWGPCLCEDARGGGAPAGHRSR